MAFAYLGLVQVVKAWFYLRFATDKDSHSSPRHATTPLKGAVLMTTNAGLWIDHRKAVIVTIVDKQVSTRQIDSDVERHVRLSGGSASGGSHGSRTGAPEDTRERHFEGQLDKYYDEVVKSIQGAEGILILGPGEAKGELKSRLEHDGLGARVLEVVTADKMTDPQIVARVRERFIP